MPHKIDKPIAMVGMVQVALGIAGSGNVHAFCPVVADVDIICTNAGNELMPEFLSQVEINYGVSRGMA